MNKAAVNIHTQVSASTSPQLLSRSRLPLGQMLRGRGICAQCKASVTESPRPSAPCWVGQDWVRSAVRSEAPPLPSSPSSPFIFHRTQRPTPSQVPSLEGLTDKLRLYAQSIAHPVLSTVRTCKPPVPSPGGWMAPSGSPCFPCDPFVTQSPIPL